VGTGSAAKCGLFAALIHKAAPDTQLTPGTVTACGTVDIFLSYFTGTDGQTYWVTVKLGERDCPSEGDIGVQGDVGDSSRVNDVGKLLLVGPGAGGVYLIPQAEVQATFAQSYLPRYSLGNHLHGTED
jgi:hypothetical protein